MKGGYTRLFDDQASGDKVSEYADAHSTPLPAHITAYHAHASASRHDSEMLSSNFQSKLHLFLARSIGAKRGESVSDSSTLVLVRNHGKSCNPGKIRDPGASHHFVHAPSIYIYPRPCPFGNKLMRMVFRKIVLEVGVYVGYSAMLWAHATGPDGLVTGLEYSPELAKIAQDALAKEGINNVEIIVGNAAETCVIPSPHPLECVVCESRGSFV